MLDEVVNNPWVRAAAVIGSLALVVLLAYLLSPVLVSLFFAFILAYVFDPVVDFFERKGIGRMTTIMVLALIGVGILLAVPLYFLPGLITEADDLRRVAEERMKSEESSTGILDWAGERLPLRSLVEALGWVPEGVEDYDPVSVLAVEGSNRVREGATDFLTQYGKQLATAGEVAGVGVVGFFSAIGRWLLSIVLAIGNFVLFAFVGAYLLRDFDTIVETARKLIPPRHTEKVSEIVSSIDGQLRGFLRGQGFVCLFLGIMYAVGLTIAGVPFGLALGLFGGIASFVPYLGLILTIGPAVGLCLAQHGVIDWHLGVVAATFIIAQVLEGTLITPKVVGEQVGLGPVWVILAVLVFGNALGFLGLLLAVPIAATLKVVVLEGVAYYRNSEVFQAEQD